MKKTPLLLIVLLSGAATAQNAAPFRNAETGRGYSNLQQAVDSIGEGEGTIIIAPFSFSPS